MDESARSMTFNCLSVAFFRTREYTRFFSPAEALRIKLANSVVLTVFFLENMEIPLNAAGTDQSLKVRGSIFFRDMVVNLVNTGLVQSVGVIGILEQ